MARRTVSKKEQQAAENQRIAVKIVSSEMYEAYQGEYSREELVEMEFYALEMKNNHGEDDAKV